jgi:hypothetical protein
VKTQSRLCDSIVRVHSKRGEQTPELAFVFAMNTYRDKKTGRFISKRNLNFKEVKVITKKKERKDDKTFGIENGGKYEQH